MFTYLILTTRGLIMAAVILGVMFGYAKHADRRYLKNIIRILAVVGMLASIVISYFRNATSMIDSAILNGCIYAVSLVCFVLLLIFSFKPARGGIRGTLIYTLAGILEVTVIAYAFPEIWAYPYHIFRSEETAISTDFLMGIIGLTAGIVLMIVVFLSVKNSMSVMSEKAVLRLLKLELLINAAMRFSGLVSVLFQKKIIKSNHTLFVYTVFVKNHEDWFIYAALILAIAVSVLVWVKSIRQKEPYRNPAEHRSILARWRRNRRWAVTVIVACILGVCNLTVVEAMNSNEVTLSPVEDASVVDDENIYVDFDKVDDGHLHRFAYKTDNDIQVRFIIIKKPNSKSYGVGLDACDVCGEAGYYERDGQVVCSRCDVVMNISTIGFKGGCNPIVIPYEIKNGQIIVPIAGLVENESEFKK